ncbi:MAG: T9SS type A sorting domain-containing protein [Bacteroidetes bacterium]|nr:T9SS type A sorting domain-containing protein [Bacteroidota bacterium]
MKKVFALLLLAILVSSAFAQQFNGMTGSQICSRNKQNRISHMDPALLSPNTPRHSYDVQKYTLNLDIYNCFKTSAKTFTGSEIMSFRVDSSLSSIQLNAVYSSIGIDSVRLNGGAALVFSHSSSTNLLTVTLDRTYNINEMVTLYIKYHHNNVSDGSFNVGSGYVYTDCEPEGAREWFPCWDRPSDKATFDIKVKVPSNVNIGSNGRLADSVVSADTIWYHWISRDPLSTYLAVLTGKTGYNVSIVWWHKISNPNDSIPIRLYYSTGENIAPTRDAIADMTTYYSQMFGEHPYEKNGFASVSSYGGGMENQTLTTISPSWSSVNYLISHEYGHQWFGDLITCGTWADIWLNEGFATYLEALYYEHTSGYAAYKNSIVGNANSYMGSNPGWPIYNPSWAITTPPVGTLFNGAITYDKGACVLHMLRYTIGDSLFFAGLKAYATDTVNFKFKNAVTDDFTAKMSSVAGQDLTWFIEEWVKQPNHPAYQNTYGISNLGGGSWRVNFKASQTLSNTTFHKMPIVIKVSFTSGSDSLIRVMNDVNNQTFLFTFNRQPTAVVFDPNNDIVIKTATLTVGVNNLENEVPKDFSLEQNFPNPFNPETSIKFGIPKNAFVTLKIFDATGREIAALLNEQRSAGVYTVEWKASSYPSGVYFYTIKAGEFSETKKMLLVK